MRGISDEELLQVVNEAYKKGLTLSQLAEQRGWQLKTLSEGYRRAKARKTNRPDTHEATCAACGYTEPVDAIPRRTTPVRVATATWSADLSLCREQHYNLTIEQLIQFSDRVGPQHCLIEGADQIPFLMRIEH